MNTLLLCAAFAVFGPSNEKVCEVTEPTIQDAVVETKKMEGGIAFRLHLKGKGERTIENEEWIFDFGKDLKCWPVSHAQGEYKPYTLSTIAKMKFAPGASRSTELKRRYIHYIEDSAESPLVAEAEKFVAALGDAGVLDYSRIRFMSGARKGIVKTVLEGPSTVTLPYLTPWRYIHIAKTCTELAEKQKTFLDELNLPSRISDVSWIKPGKVLRVSKLDTKVGKAAVDFVKANGMDYIELDAGWYGQERTGDPRKPGLDPKYIARGDQFDFFAILNYAKSKNVGVILYVNREPLKKWRDEILDLFVKWGVKGVKYGFVDVGAQKWRKWTIEAIEAAAKRHLLVDIHDEFRLTGIEKTYPNVLTVEGIRGNEEMPSAEHNAALVYTRYLDGPGDYTPCWKINRVRNTLAHQLAMPAVYTSGFQFLYWYSKPSDIRDEMNALDFWREIPVIFDETRHLAGEIGKYAVVARRAGKKWFVGGLNGGERRVISVHLPDFVQGETYRARMWKDARPEVVKSLGSIAAEQREVKRDDAIPFDCAANGGFALILEER